MAKCKATIGLVLVLLCSITIATVYQQPVKAQYNGDVTIDAYGNIAPSTTPIFRMGNIFTLTENLNGAITVERSNIILDGNHYRLSGGLTLNNISNVTITNFNIVGGVDPHNTFIGVYGILLNSDTNIRIENSTISGIWDIQAMNAVSYTGLIVQDGSFNTIAGNVFVNNLRGMSLFDTSNNLIERNTITCETNSWNLYDSVGGIYFANASDNTIYHNNFNVTIGSQAGDNNSINVWDDGYPSGGNYWSDYHSKYPRAQMIGDSGIGNVSYVVDSQNKDNYPLLSPFDFSLFLFRTTKPEIQVLSAENQTYSSNNVAFNYAIDKATSWMGYSLDNKDNVTVTGNFTIANMTNGMHNIAIYANDTFGNMGIQTTNFNVNQINSTADNYPVVTQTLVIIAVVAVITVIMASLLLYRRHRKNQVKKV